MEGVLKTTSLIQRAYWLIKLRWAAIAALVAATFCSRRFMGISLAVEALYAVAVLVGIYNLGLYGLLRYWTRDDREPSDRRIGGLLTLQISADLLILATILHFSGGIENPFFLFFVFHIIIASILRSRWQSYVQATLATLLFGGVVVLEATGGLRHYELSGFAAHGLHDDWTYIGGFLFVFTVTLYLAVYLTTSISEQLRRQQENYEQVNAELQAKDRLMHEYVLRVTHDIKGHLAAVQSCLDVVVSEILGPLTDKQKNFVNRAHRRTSKCVEFINALLKLTRMKLTGRLDLEEFSLRETIVSALALVQNRAQSKSVRLNHELDPAIDRIAGEAVLIEETITNILLNAVKYTPEGGRVSMAATRKGDLVEIRIADTGIGIPDGDRTRIFEEFFRADNARATERDGTGLGLAFARQVVERHGGRIWAESNPGGGSVFVFTLPGLVKREA